MSWGAIIAGAATVIGGYMSNRSASRANRQTQAGIAEAADTIQESSEEGKKLLDPAVGVGMSSMPVIQQTLQGMGEAGEYGTNQLRDLGSQPLNVSSFLDPSMKFAQTEGQKAIEASAAARGGLVSGATLKSLTKYATDTASQNYNNAAGLALNDRGQRLGAASNLAGQGSNALSGLLDIYGSGVNAAGQQAQIIGNTGTNIANLQMSAANASAANSAARGSNNSSMIGSLGGIIGSFFSDENAKQPVGMAGPQKLTITPTTPSATPKSGSQLHNAYENWKSTTAPMLTFLGRPVQTPTPVGPPTSIPRPVMDDAQLRALLGQMGGMSGLWSDIHSKEALGDVNEEEIDRFLSQVNPKEFKYNASAKAAGAPEGDQTGVVAQDLEKSKIGKRLVGQDPNTGYKTVDVPQSVGTLLAVAASQNKRIKKLEKKNA